MKTKIAFVKATALTDVCGRIDYVSNPDRQRTEDDLEEKLLGFYQTPEDPTFWRKLAETNHRNNSKYNRSDIVIEAREHVLQISNGIYNVAVAEDHAAIAKEIAEEFKAKHGVEVAVAVHMNDGKTDYHAHIIFAERKLIRADVDRAPATRNTYFDELGRRSTKAACTDENGKLKKNCTLVKKGESFPAEIFGPKIEEFAKPAWLRSEKERQGKWMTQLCREYGVYERWIRYNHETNPHLRLHNLKRGEPAALRAWKEHENEKIRAYNKTIDELISGGEISLEEALAIKAQVYKNLAERRLQNKLQREARRAEFEKNQEFYALERERWRAFHFDAEGNRRGLIEALAILVLVVVGIDVDKVLGIESNVEYPEERQKGGVLYIKHNKVIQNMIDEIYRDAGKETPTEMMARKRAERMAAAQIAGRKPGLSDVIAGAEQQCNDQARNFRTTSLEDLTR